jgi:hypothetical protein
MIGYCYRNGPDYVFIVPYLFIAKIGDCGDKLRISFNPQHLAGVTLAIRNQKEMIREKLWLGIDGWRTFDLGNWYARRIMNFCDRNEINEASCLAKEIIYGNLEFSKTLAEDGN